MSNRTRYEDQFKARGGKPSRAFSRAQRLLRAGDYARVFQQPRRSSDRYFTVLARPTTSSVSRNCGQAVSRLGLAIAKKQVHRAVDRNRIKRLIREYFRTEVLPADTVPQDYVVMARAAVREASNRRLRASLATHFQRLRSSSLSDTQTEVP